MVQDVTINGITYPGVEAVDYVDKSGVKHSLDKLMLNNAVVWRKPVPLPEKDTLENMSWEDISTVCKAGKAAEYWSVGDQKTINVKEYNSKHGYYVDEEYSVELIGFDHDVVSDPAKYGREMAGATFQLRNLLATQYHEYYQESWKKFNIRTSFLADVYNNRLSDVPKKCIVSVQKQSYSKSKKSVTTTDKLFLLSEYEIDGALTYSYAPEGKQYKYYSTIGRKIKKIGGDYDAAGDWYTRSLLSDDSHNCYVVRFDTSGKIEVGNAKAYISFAFCV